MSGKIEIAFIDPTPLQFSTASVYISSYHDELSLTPLYGREFDPMKSYAYDLILLPVDHPRAHDPAAPEGVYRPSPSVLLYGERRFTRTALSLPCKDYIPLPFTKEELIGRILRAAPSICMLYGELHLRIHKDSVTYGSVALPLTSDERIILRSLAEAYPDPVPRTILFRNLHKNLPEESRYIDVVIAGLRKKLISLTSRETTPIHAERSLGYRL